jgi:impB/mucB/samB family
MDPATPDPAVMVRDKRVLDANRLARQRGVVPDMDVPQARNLVCEAKFIEWNEEEHVENQRKWLDVCTNFTGVIEPVDQHIAILDLSTHPNPLDIAERLVCLLVQKMSLRLRHGAGPSPWIAQLASQRPNSSTAALDPGVFLAGLPVNDLTPIPLVHRQHRAGCPTSAKCPSQSIWRRSDPHSTSRAWWFSSTRSSAVSPRVHP